jgi:quercetin dioxygenase-like cupin family protein
MQYLDNIEAKEIRPGFFGKMVHGDKSTVAFWEIRKGSVLEQHHHPQEQITHILEGELEMTIGGRQFLFTAGTVHVIPSDIPHSARALTDCKVIDFFSPSRDDYR